MTVRVPVGIRLLPHSIDRGLALTVSTWGGLLGLFAETSLVAQAHATVNAALLMNTVALALCALGWADLIWQTLTGRLILPSLDPLLRHLVCVGTYSALGGVWMIKAFVSLNAWFSGKVPDAAWLMGFALLVAFWCGVLAVKIALEHRR